MSKHSTSPVLRRSATNRKGMSVWRVVTLTLVKKTKTATSNEHTSVLAGILSDISDDSDTDFIYILLASKCQQCNNEEHFKWNKKPNEITVSL